MEQLIEEAIEALDALDAAQADMEPDCDGETEPEEASAQPATLAPDRLVPLNLLHQPGEYPSNIVAFPRRLRTVQVSA